MTHVFVSPHPDDIALSCGGLVASLRELGQSVTILTVFSGSGATDGNSMSDYQRAALGFGTKANWPLTQAFRRDNIGSDYPVEAPVGGGNPPWMADPDRLDVTQQYANTQTRQFWQRAAWTRSANITNEEADERPIADTIGGQGSLSPIVFSALDAMETRKVEEERYAWFAEASVIFLDLPDAVYRGYEGNEQLLATPRADDPPPYELLRSEILRLEPQQVYFPLGIGNHVDHQLCREVGLALLAERRAWVMSAGRLEALIDSLRRTISGLRWDPSQTNWAAYGETTSYSERGAKSKQELVGRFLAATDGDVVWDLGANNGLYTRLAAELGRTVFAVDGDSGAAEQLFRDLRQASDTRITPLVVDLSNPSPALGWAGSERRSLSERANADVLIALALIHHLAIGNNVPFGRVSSYLAELGRQLIIEFVPKEDPRVVNM